MAKFRLNLNLIANRTNSISNRKFRYQVLATLTVCILTFSHGVGLGWLSPTLSKLQSDASPLDFPVSVDEASWIGSLLGLGSVCGNIAIGFLQNAIGRKICIYIIAIPHIAYYQFSIKIHLIPLIILTSIIAGIVVLNLYILQDTIIYGSMNETTYFQSVYWKTLNDSEIYANFHFILSPFLCLWTLIYCADRVELLMIGRFLGGFAGGGCYVVLPLFISEIADTSIRGTLSTMLMLSVNFGILVGYIVSTHLAYHIIPFCIVALPIIYLLLSLVFPETPQHLLRKKKYTAAEESFRFYKNCGADSKQDCHEGFQHLRSVIDNLKEQGSLSYRDFVTKDALKCFTTAAVLLFVNQFSGIFAFVNYMSSIFANSGSTMDPNTSTIIMGVLQIAGTYTATLLVDSYGRKILMLWSTGGMAVGLAAFGAYTYYSHSVDLSDYSFVPLLLMAFVVFVGNVGMIALTLVILVEIFPAKIRPVCASVSMSILSFLVFAMLKIFPLFMHHFGISITMWSCALVCASSYVYLFLFLDETKGKSMDCD